MRKSLCLVPVAMLVLSGCNDHYNNSGGSIFGASSGGGIGSSGGSSSGSSSGVSSNCSVSTGSQELTGFVLQLFSCDTIATAKPVDLTTVTLSDNPAMDAGAFNSLFASGS